YRKFMRELGCHACGAKRLRPQSLFVRVGGKGLADVMALSLKDAGAWVSAGGPGGAGRAIAEGPLREVRSRLQFLLNVGLDYLTLERPGPSLSGGEAQRIRLASQLGSELSGVVYVVAHTTL